MWRWGKATVRYIDLEVDIIHKDGEWSVIDEDGLDRLPAPLRELAVAEVEKLLSHPDRIKEVVANARELLSAQL